MVIETEYEIGEKFYCCDLKEKSVDGYEIIDISIVINGNIDISYTGKKCDCRGVIYKVFKQKNMFKTAFKAAEQYNSQNEI